MLRWEVNISGMSDRLIMVDRRMDVLVAKDYFMMVGGMMGFKNIVIHGYGDYLLCLEYGNLEAWKIIMDESS